MPSKYRKDIGSAISLLKNEGCQSIFPLGSLVTGKIHDYSGIDIGIKGLPKGKFFDVYSRLYFETENRDDLFVNSNTNSGFHIMLNKTGEVAQSG
jgi:hypothetical protein